MYSTIANNSAVAEQRNLGSRCCAAHTRSNRRDPENARKIVHLYIIDSNLSLSSSSKLDGDERQTSRIAKVMQDERAQRATRILYANFRFYAFASALRAFFSDSAHSITDAMYLTCLVVARPEIS